MLSIRQTTLRSLDRWQTSVDNPAHPESGTCPQTPNSGTAECGF